MIKANSKLMVMLVVALVGVTFAFSMVAQAETIVHWQHSSAGRNEVIEEMAKEFERLYGVKVEIVLAPLNDYYTKLLPALASGSGPDVMAIRATDVPVYRDYGVLAPLKIEDENAAEQFVPGAIGDLVDDDGVFWGRPTGIQTIVMFYNTRLFAEAGIETVPQTWDELIEVAKQLAIADQHGMLAQSGVSHGTYGPVLWSFMAQAHDGEWMDENGKALFDTPEVREAFAWLTKWNTEFGVDAARFGEQWALFREEALAMVMGHPAMIGVFRNTHPDLPYKVALIPARSEGEPNRSVQTGWSFSMSSKASNPELASKWVEFITSEDNYRTMTLGTGELAPMYSLLEDPAVLEKDPSLRIPLQSMDPSVPFPFAPFIQMVDAVQEAMELVTIGGETPDNAFDWLVKEAEKIHQEVF